MLRAFVVCAVSLICSVLAVVALVAFAESGWDAVHPWISLMALVGSLGLLGIGWASSCPLGRVLRSTSGPTD